MSNVQKENNLAQMQHAQMQQDTFKQMPIAKADEGTGIKLSAVPTRMDERVFRPTDFNVSVFAREALSKTLEDMHDVAVASGHENVFGTGGLKVKKVDEFRVSKDGNTYSVKVDNGEKYLTLRLEKDATSLALSNNTGVLLAIVRQKGKEMTFEQLGVSA
ncbi:hypothetical protein J4441_04515 [Candidatus Micrarchaeota archaeon]|nr:hypothetical protein [Candidatus Micrarchaeota archaeon]